MAELVNPKRRYNSTRRQAQAAATRLAILEEAERLFTEHGYSATTIAGVASGAGVSEKTVYDAFATKPGMLRALWDLRLKGDVDDAPVAARPWYTAMLAEPEPHRIVALLAKGSVTVKQRIGDVLRIIRSAAGVDEESARLWELIQTDFHANQSEVVKALAARDGLRRGLSVAKATDILWMLNHPDVWLLLVGERGWSPAQFKKWFEQTVTEQLLEPARSQRSATR
jgi:AcrR family transcriptional regulator